MAPSAFADFTARYEAGDTLFSKGDEGHTLFVVQSGAVELLLSADENCKEEVLAVMEKGDFFGEMSLLEGTPRTLTARVAEDSDIIEISPALFDRMIRANIELAVRMLRKLSIRLSETEKRLATSRPRTVQVEPQAKTAGDEPETAATEQPAIEEAPAATEEAPAVPEQKAEEPQQGEPVQEEPPRSAAPATQETPASKVQDTGPGYLVNPEGDEIFSMNEKTIRVGRFDPVTGTRPEVDLTLLDMQRSVSRRHALLTVSDDGIMLSEEVGALNGTAVNGKSVSPGEPAPVEDGDQLSFGSVILRYQTAAP